MTKNELKLRKKYRFLFNEKDEVFYGHLYALKKRKVQRARNALFVITAIAVCLTMISAIITVISLLAGLNFDPIIACIVSGTACCLVVFLVAITTYEDLWERRFLEKHNISKLNP